MHGTEMALRWHCGATHGSVGLTRARVGPHPVNQWQQGCDESRGLDRSSKVGTVEPRLHGTEMVLRWHCGAKGAQWGYQGRVQRHTHRRTSAMTTEMALGWMRVLGELAGVAYDGSVRLPRSRTGRTPSNLGWYCSGESGGSIATSAAVPPPGPTSLSPSMRMGLQTRSAAKTSS